MPGSSDLRSLFSFGGGDIDAQEVFANRHDEWKAVVDGLLAHVARVQTPDFRVDDFVGPRRNVLVFYGVGGIGKTMLSKQLEAHLLAKEGRHPVVAWSAIPDQVGRLLPVRIDLARQGGVDFEDAVLAVRLVLGRLGRPMRAFDLAMRHYWEVNHPGEPLEGYLQRNGFLRRLSDSVSLPEDMRAVMEDVAQAVEMPSAIGASALSIFSTFSKLLRNRHDKAIAFARCARLPDLLEADQDIETLGYFPHLLAWDLAQIPPKHSSTPVILLDTFEEISDRSHREVEKLFQRMVWLMPNALFVITSRNRLEWDNPALEGQFDWAGPHRWPGLAPGATGEPRQHLVGYLSDHDREQYLRDRLTRAGEPAIPGPVRDEISARSYGLPLYLDLAVMRFQDLLSRNGVTPDPEEFQRDFPALVARIVRDLSPDERTVLRTVSLLDSFTIDLATEAAGLSRDAAALNLVEHPFVTHDPAAPWPYRLHDLLRTTVRAADATTEDRWSPADWRRAARTTLTALGTRVPVTGGYRWRQGLMSCLTQGLNLACEYDLEPDWLVDAAWRYVMESVWEPLEIAEVAENDCAASGLAKTLHAISLGQRADRQVSVDELTDVLASDHLSAAGEDLARYYLGENQRHLGLFRESAANMRHVAAGTSPMAGQALRGLSHIARHLGEFPEALSTIEALDHDTHYYRALGHLWWVHADFTRAFAAYTAGRQAALDHDQPGPAALAQAGLAFATALGDADHAAGQIALANKLLRGLNQTWSQAQVSTAVLLQDVGRDTEWSEHVAELERSYSGDGLGSALAYLRFADCFHRAVRDDRVGLHAARGRLEQCTAGGEYYYLVEIAHFFDDTTADMQVPPAQWIDGADTVARRWRTRVADRRRALGLKADPAPGAGTRVERMADRNVHPFNAESSHHTLQLAALEADVRIDDARLLRMGENAIYALESAGVVARIARSDERLPRVEKELAVARWLAHHGYPAVRVAERLPQPIRVDGRVVTFWNLVDIVGEATTDQLAALLREFHSLPQPGFPLQTFDPFVAVPDRLSNPGNADPDDVAFLTEMYHQLRESYSAIEFPELTTIHGDAHLGNVLATANGPLLSDFEVVAHGPWQWTSPPSP
ncbi:aminoglycoside phosphotransferase family protein [Nocardia sp. alder85J]|uniref:aminoglycoside phosphotransferase family protein n=1 Tax=Nocardia sp. alder85J TaxID=2862949 RepID=UPI001CD4BDFF|nr:aminoglycoside phosphotransferase family protein [Nocardia sp. alder85J]MCX4094696.1 aminoglycoside phosphotransferase family protein [Nocardia sp. alder85J]